MNEIIFEPYKKYTTQIEEWLEEEYRQNGEGLLHNFQNEDLDKNNFICFVDSHDKAVGFMVYQCRTTRTIINLASVKQSERKKGICAILLESLTAKLVLKGIVVLDLFCSPASSEKVWMKLGFERFKERENHRFLNSNDFKHPYLYKTIVPVRKPTTRKKLTTFIELWTLDESDVSIKDLPTYRWDVSDNEDKRPIVYPVDGYWKVRYVIDGLEKWSGKMDRFVFSFSDYGNFLIFKLI